MEVFQFDAAGLSSPHSSACRARRSDLVDTALKNHTGHVAARRVGPLFQLPRRTRDVPYALCDKLPIDVWHDLHVRRNFLDFASGFRAPKVRGQARNKEK